MENSNRNPKKMQEYINQELWLSTDSAYYECSFKEQRQEFDTVHDFSILDRCNDCSRFTIGTVPITTVPLIR